MTHPNIRVGQVIGGYALAIKYLINNPTEEGKGQKAFDYTMTYSKKSHMDSMLLEWLIIAKDLIGQENKEGFIELVKYNP